MAVVHEYSDEYDYAYVAKTGNLRPDQLHGRVRLAFFHYQHTGAAEDTGSTVALCKLPAGRVRLLASQSIAEMDVAAPGIVDVGWDQYTDIDNNTVAASSDGIDNDLDTSGAGYLHLGNALAQSGGTKLFSSKDGVVIRVKLLAPLIDTLISGYLLYVVD